MSSEKFHKILLNSKIFIGICAAVSLVLGVALIAQVFIDTHNYRDEIIKAVEAQTNKKVTIKGTVSASLLPLPTLYITGMELRDPDNDQPTPTASVDLISIHVVPASVF